MVLCVVVSACTSQEPRVTFKDGTFYVRRDVPDASLVQGVLGVKVGTPGSHIRSTFGRPAHRVSVAFRGSRQTCTSYPAVQDGSSLDGLGFCIDESSWRVARVMLAVHG